jgi:hypothetical protein
MWSIATRVFMDSEMGVPTELPHAGSTLEHPLVFDRAAQEIKGLARQGLVEILSERSGEGFGDTLVTQLTFKRLQ